ncbi:MAG TPA: diguanylate cyclase [Candidatus Edwardsbacteria bacterium]|nr:diguanylate cyclase [Candidatus Edwardsbacteria bacterium]
MSLFSLLGKRPKSFIFSLALVLVALIGYIDYRTGYEISLTLFYLMPVIIVTWYIGFWWGILISAVSAGTWLLADWAAGQIYSSFAGFWNEVMRLAFFLVITYTLTELRRSLRRERQLARTDPLTGLLNRRAFYELGAIEIQRIRRFFRPFTLVYFDMDGFKGINDAFGHDSGDRLLSDVAAVLRANTRAVDAVARMGGDEFALLIPEAGPETARPLAEKLQRLLLDRMRADGFGVTFSIGAVSVLAPPPSLDAVLALADRLVYGVKDGGKNGIQYQIFSDQPAAAPGAANGGPADHH